jgi:ATP-dependent helicase/nuclease subunit B
MLIRFLSGRAGSGKTYRCLEEIRNELSINPAGPEIVLLVPKQATFQLEQQLLGPGLIQGYTRLQILSFERLAHWILKKSGQKPPPIVSNEGRLMILRAVIEQEKEKLSIFRSSARLGGFLREINGLFSVFHVQGISPERLYSACRKFEPQSPLGQKLSDLAVIFEATEKWCDEHHLLDSDALLSIAVNVLKGPVPLQIGAIWLDGFAELTPQETELLIEIIKRAGQTTLAFPGDPSLHQDSALLPAQTLWSEVRQTVGKLRQTIENISGAEIDFVSAHSDVSRFKNAWIEHLEKSWDRPRPFIPDLSKETPISFFSCSNPQEEVVVAAREIIAFVQQGGRYRQIAVTVRNLKPYQAWIPSIFGRFEIPYFLDRRESIAHHALVRLTLGALKLAGRGFQHQDWFEVLKTGLVVDDSDLIDRIENSALIGGWNNNHWMKGFPTEPEESYRTELIRPFLQFFHQLGPSENGISGEDLADCLQQLWVDLRVVEKLIQFDEDANSVTRDFLTLKPARNRAIFERVESWLRDLKEAFGKEKLSLHHWLEVADAGLSQLTVGIVPPSLDQVLIGSVDRSRNPDLQKIIVLGFNEGIFPAPMETSRILAENEISALAGEGLRLGDLWQSWSGRERFLAYIACTRARNELTVTWARTDSTGKVLNPSVFVGHLRLLFPTVKVQELSTTPVPRHSSEVLTRIFQVISPQPETSGFVLPPEVESLRTEYLNWKSSGPLSPAVVEKLYGKKLRTSVSKFEQFAACPYRFFLNSGLRAEERQEMEFSVKEQGTFQHELLAGFHDEVKRRHKLWRDLAEQEIDEILAQEYQRLNQEFRPGLFESQSSAQFYREMLFKNVRRFIGKLMKYFPRYAFDPHSVEIPFGKEGGLPEFEVQLSSEHTLVFSGIVDRIDVCRISEPEEALLVVVIDYKSSSRELEEILMQACVQIQLPVYLAMLGRLPESERHFSLSRLIPAGMFFANLAGVSRSARSRSEAFDPEETAAESFVQFRGRFSFNHLDFLDRGGMERKRGPSQFKFRIKKDGAPYKTGNEALLNDQFASLLFAVEERLKELGERIFQGEIGIDPYEHKNKQPCEYCAFPSVCRIDRLMHSFRSLKAKIVEPEV